MRVIERRPTSRFFQPSTACAALLLAALAAGCSGNGGTPVGGPTPMPTATLAPALACNTPALQAGDTRYAIGFTGNLPAGGGTFTALANGFWTQETALSGTPVPTLASSGSPLPPGVSPAPSATPRVVDVYAGTYTMEDSQPPTVGCFYLIATTDGSAIHSGSSPASSALAVGDPNNPSSLPLATVAHGVLTVLSLSVNSAGTGSGTFTLDNGLSGVITIVSLTQDTLPLAHDVSP